MAELWSKPYAKIWASLPNLAKYLVKYTFEWNQHYSIGTIECQILCKFITHYLLKFLIYHVQKTLNGQNLSYLSRVSCLHDFTQIATHHNILINIFAWNFQIICIFTHELKISWKNIILGFLPVTYTIFDLGPKKIWWQKNRVLFGFRPPNVLRRKSREKSYYTNVLKISCLNIENLGE